MNAAESEGIESEGIEREMNASEERVKFIVHSSSFLWIFYIFPVVFP